LAHRHPTIGRDHHRVQGEPHQQQRHPEHPDVDAGEEQQERVGNPQDSHPHQEVRAVTGVGEVECLEPQPDERQPPMTQVQPFEAA